jgi:hypothetical protein
MAGANTTNIKNLSSINPLIDPDGDTFVVSSVLSTIAWMFDKNGDPTMLDNAQTFGMSMILQTCVVALREMSEMTESKR